MVYFFNLYIFFFFPVALQAYFALAKELRYRTGANSVCANKVNTSRAEDIPSSSVARTSIASHKWKASDLRVIRSNCFRISKSRNRAYTLYSGISVF
jgi:hypothetical protein